MTTAHFIEFALGLLLFFTVLSLVVSGIQEWIAQLASLRANNLRQGIRNLISDPYAAALYEHGLIKGLYRRATRRGPSYIPAKHFTEALLDGLGLSDFDVTGGNSLRDYVDQKVTKNEELKQALCALAGAVDNDLSRFKAEVSEWFDESMNRASGWYARKMRWVGLCSAAVVIFILNADTVRIASELWQSTALRTQLAEAANAVRPELDSVISTGQISEVLSGLPLGWPCENPLEPPMCVLNLENWSASTVPGWMISIFAVSLGAPFWFDLLGRVARLRSTGKRPDQL